MESCGHIFKYDALLNWLMRHQTCPNCRHNVLLNTSLIRYTDNTSNEEFFLTQSQFRRHLVRRVFQNFVNANADTTNSVSIVLR